MNKKSKKKTKTTGRKKEYEVFFEGLERHGLQAAFGNGVSPRRIIQFLDAVGDSIFQ